MLRENALPLQVERLLLAFAHRTVVFCLPPVILAYKAAFDLRLLQGICHLFLQGFTF
jgi:hypothetical protein